MKEIVTPMRQTGYYFVDEIGRIAYYNGVHWTMCGTQDRYLGHTFDAVSTPITPEKMAAIDEILAMAKSLAGSQNSVAVADGLYDIINKYQLHNKP